MASAWARSLVGIRTTRKCNLSFVARSCIESIAQSDCARTCKGSLCGACRHGTLDDSSTERYRPPGMQALPDDPEVSIVMPCLNEADTLGTCIQKAQQGLRVAGIAGEIIVADNGSTDGSRQIAIDAGARLVDVARKGYGSALMGGIEAARGRFVVMGDADDSYDFGEVAKFVERLRAGDELVQGCRLPAGGGSILPGAMPFLHRWWGNPMFTALVRHWFGSPLHDVYCGLRGFTRDLYQRLNQRCTGMEFAIEMIVKSCLAGVRIGEVPITLHPDGRKAHPPHLRTFRDGWRTLRFLLLYSPSSLFLTPALILVLLGLAGYGLALPGVRFGAATFDAHTLLVSSLSMIVGHQVLLYGLFARAFAEGEGLLPPRPGLGRWLGMSLESGLLFGVAIALAGLAFIAMAALGWIEAGYGRLDYSRTMRLVVPGATLLAVGTQSAFGAFLLGVLRLGRR